MTSDESEEAMILSYRLEAVISTVRPVICAADIGTDHGFVPVELVRRGICESALAMDLRPGPLSRAEGHIKEAGLDGKINVRLSDGLEKLDEGEAQCVIIAGMGGELMLRILTDGERLWRSVSQWVLSPQSEQYKVRAFLDRNGFAIHDEKFLYEDGKYYNILDVVPSDDPGRRGIISDDDEFDAGYVYGRSLIEKDDQVLKRFLAEEEEKLNKLCKRLSSLGEESGSAAQGFMRAERLLSLNREVQDEMH